MFANIKKKVQNCVLMVDLVQTRDRDEPADPVGQRGEGGGVDDRGGGGEGVAQARFSQRDLVRY